MDRYGEDKEWPFSGVTDSGRVLSKVPEREAWGVLLIAKRSKSEITGGIQNGTAWRQVQRTFQVVPREKSVADTEYRIFIVYE